MRLACNRRRFLSALALGVTVAASPARGRRTCSVTTCFHTGGVPGRHEIDETQELNYRHIALTISALGYGGFISHEWTPSAGQDKLAVLRKSIAILDV